jgi:hypothetical protein
MYLACDTTLAPSLTNFSRSVVSVQPWTDVGDRKLPVPWKLRVSEDSASPAYPSPRSDDK